MIYLLLRREERKEKRQGITLTKQAVREEGRESKVLGIYLWTTIRKRFINVDNFLRAWLISKK